MDNILLLIIIIGLLIYLIIYLYHKENLPIKEFFNEKPLFLNNVINESNLSKNIDIESAKFLKNELAQGKNLSELNLGYGYPQTQKNNLLTKAESLVCNKPLDPNKLTKDPLSNTIMHELPINQEVLNTPIFCDGGIFPENDLIMDLKNFDDKRFKKYKDVMEKSIDKNNMNAADFLPQEKSSDGFDLPYDDKLSMVEIAEMSSPEFRSGINSISSCKKNACYDIRGDFAIPKIAVAWGNSPYECGGATKGLCN